MIRQPLQDVECHDESFRVPACTISACILARWTIDVAGKGRRISAGWRRRPSRSRGARARRLRTCRRGGSRRLQTASIGGSRPQVGLQFIQSGGMLRVTGGGSRTCERGHPILRDRRPETAPDFVVRSESNFPTLWVGRPPVVSGRFRTKKSMSLRKW